MNFVGPGFIMSIAFLDPGNIAGDMSAGVQGKYSLIWLLLWATLLGLYYQSMSARLGTVTQRSLAKLCREQYSKKTRILLWIMIELSIIGSDIQEVIGTATAFYILFGIPLWAGALITIMDSFLFLSIHYFGVRKLEMFFTVPLTIMAIAFVTNMIVSDPDYKEIIVGTAIPNLPKNSLSAALGLVGAILMPPFLHLHSALVLSRKIDMKSRNSINQANHYIFIETTISLMTSFFISAAVISTFASYVIKNPGDSDLTLLEASNALASTFGDSAKYIWAIGLLAAG